MSSTVIQHFGYDPQQQVLTVRFRSGRCYAYHGVPAEVHAAFRAAFSRGAFFNAHIRDRYRHDRIDDPDP